EGIIGFSIEIDAEFLELAPNLKVISTISVGYNHLNINELTKRGIIATHTPNILNDTVADTMRALMLATARNIPLLDRYVKNNERFDIPILYHNRTRKPEAKEKYNAKYLELDELLRQSDYIILITP